MAGTEFDTPHHNPYQTPTASVETSVDESSFELAGRGARLAAVIIDALAVGGVAAIAGIAAAIVIPQISHGGARPPTIVWVILGAIMSFGILGILFYQCVLLHRNGQTIGKKTLGLKVVRDDGSRCGLRRYVFLRGLPMWILGAIPLIGYIVGLVDPLLIFRESRQCLHDQIASTIVIMARN